MPQVEDGQRATSRANKLAWKRQGIDLLVVPCLLNDKLSPWTSRSVGPFRRSVERRNKTYITMT